jgi:hypothetical protein
MNTGRHLLDQGTALRQPIANWRRNCNPVTRIGAFSEGRAEKAALGYGYRSRVNSGQILPRKEIDRLLSGLVPGVSPAPCKAWLSGDADIRALVPRPSGQIEDHAQSSVGAKIDRLKRCAVNGTESGNRLTRFTTASVVALTGGDACPIKGDEQ